MKYEVMISERAHSRIRAQARYIADERLAPDAAARWLEKMIDAAGSLAEMPRRSALAEEDAHRSYEVRQLLVENYLLLYTIIDETQSVWIIGFRHGRQRADVEQLPRVIPPVE